MLKQDDVFNKFSSQVSLEGGGGHAGQQQQQQQMEAGQVLVTLLPVNEKLPWVTPARYTEMSSFIVYAMSTPHPPPPVKMSKKILRRLYKS
jgi:hypothetical protein